MGLGVAAGAAGRPPRVISADAPLRPLCREEYCSRPHHNVMNGPGAVRARLTNHSVRI